MPSHSLRQSSLVISSLFRPYLPPLQDSQRLLDMCTARTEYVIRGRFITFSSLSPFGGSGAYRINDSPHSPSPSKSARDFHHIFFVIRLSSLVISSFFRHTPPSACGLRPSASSSFFRLETLFLTFLALLYHTINQLFTHSSYTNRPRFV